MDLPMESLQSLPRQPLKSAIGARLVLCRNDTSYPGSGSPGNGRWFHNIAITDTAKFLYQINRRSSTWSWPAVVLMPEEYSLRVGEMSVTQLRSQLEEYWGRGGIPGAAVEGDYKDVWVLGWDPEWDPLRSHNLLWYHKIGTSTITPLDSAKFSRWVNREFIKWLGYFIAKNHTFGVVHAWFSMFLGVTRGSLYRIAEFLNRNDESFTEMSEADVTGHVQDMESGAAVSHLKFRMSFDVCIAGLDEVVDGIPSLPLHTEITTNKQGMQVINNSINNITPRRIWDVCANAVIPATWFCGPPCPLTGRTQVGPIGVTPISHAWAANEDLTFVVTEANQQLWPIPLPSGVLLEDVRGELIRLGVRYAWLDVLCLRQQAQPALAKDLVIPGSSEVKQKWEQRRLEEWKVDVPTIGAIYSNPDKNSIYGGGPTVIFMSGLGRPFKSTGWASERHWLRRAWTLQETPAFGRCLIAGLPGGPDYTAVSTLCWPWNCKVCTVLPIPLTTVSHSTTVVLAKFCFRIHSKENYKEILIELHGTELIVWAGIVLPTIRSRLIIMVSSFMLP